MATREATRELTQTVIGAGMAETRETLRVWGEAPWAVIQVWVAGGLAIALALLLATLAVAELSPATGRTYLIGVFRPASGWELAHVLVRNLLVLALHAMVCVAGFLAKRSLPMQAQLRHGFDRWVHEHAGNAALVWVTSCTIFSLLTQAYALGHITRDASEVLHVSNAALLATLLPHALPELTAVFLPLAAWLIAARRGDWHQLMAASALATKVALPLVALAALIECYFTPELVRALLLPGTFL